MEPPQIVNRFFCRLDERTTRGRKGGLRKGERGGVENVSGEREKEGGERGLEGGGRNGGLEVGGEGGSEGNSLTLTVIHTHIYTHAHTHTYTHSPTRGTNDRSRLTQQSSKPSQSPPRPCHRGERNTCGGRENGRARAT